MIEGLRIRILPHKGYLRCISGEGTWKSMAGYEGTVTSMCAPGGIAIDLDNYGPVTLARHEFVVLSPLEQLAREG